MAMAVNSANFYIEWINTIDAIILKMIELHPLVLIVSIQLLSVSLFSGRLM